MGMENEDSVAMKYIIFAPKGLKTGGPEGMHQLAWALNKLGREAMLLAWPKTKRNFPVADYNKYNPKWCRISEIGKKDIIVVSESVRLFPFYFMFFISRARIYMWMHSVDFSLDKDLNQYEKKKYPINSEWKISDKKDSRLKIYVRKIGVLRIYLEAKHFYNLLKKTAFKRRIEIFPSNYLFASYYSLYTVRKLKNSRSDILLTGWVNGAEIETLEDIGFCSCTKNHVSFNPSKSKELINRIIEINALRNSAIHLMPIANLKTDREVYKLLAASDLYLDLGFFPGQERTPREAIRMNCPVLLARRGAARFYQDFPISSDYLLDLFLLGPEQTYEVILKILAFGKEYNLKNQKDFKDFVVSEKNTFLIEVKHFIDLIENVTF
jgi:hypothetical protein